MDLGHGSRRRNSRRPPVTPLEVREDGLKVGLLGLVVALVEVIEEVLEREAVRRMEAGGLVEEEIDRLGTALIELNEALDRIKRENGIEEAVDRIRSDLDRLVSDALEAPP